MMDGDAVLSGKSGYELTRFNALRHGILSKHAVLPWEDRAEYDRLLEALIAEHKPKGPTQEHLVEELAIIFLRKKRLRLAEQAAHFRALQRTTAVDNYKKTSRAALVLVSADFQGRARGEAITANDAHRAAALKALQDDRTKALNALDIVRKSQTDKAYRQALSTLSEKEQATWERVAVPLITFAMDRKAHSYWESAQSLKDYIENEILPKYDDRRIELEHLELIKEQSFGEAVDPHELARIIHEAA